MFEYARLTLTAWYLIIIMVVSFLFSLTIYSGINAELHRFEKVQVQIWEDTEDGKVPTRSKDRFLRVGYPDPEVIANARHRLILTLAGINATIFGISATAGYFLAGRTLQPIKQMVEEQHRFVTDASHELRTPITALRTEIEVALRNTKLTSMSAKKVLRSNLEEVVNLQTLSENLLTLAQNGQNILPTHREVVLLQSVIDAAMSRVAILAKKKQLQIVTDIPDIYVIGVPDRLIEVFIILLDNAIKYSTNKQTIEIMAVKSKYFAEVSVIDHGIGIDKKDVPHIFDRFYRASQSRTKTSSGGYGLGLAIAKQIVEAHDGTIRINSQLGRGTIVKVQLPISQQS